MVQIYIKIRAMCVKKVEILKYSLTQQVELAKEAPKEEEEKEEEEGTEEEEEGAEEEEEGAEEEEEPADAEGAPHNPDDSDEEGEGEEPHCGLSHFKRRQEVAYKQ